MSRDVITVGSTMRIPLLYRGEYSQWCERFMNYLEEQTDGEAMINSIQNGDQPLPVIAQVSLAGTAQNAPSTLKDPKFWTAEEKKTRKIDHRKAAILYEYETFKAIEGEQLLDTYLRYLQYGTLMRQTKNLMDINIDALYNILKQNQGDVNDALGYKKKAVMVHSDPLALVAEKTNVNKQKEKAVVSSDSEGSGVDDFSKLKKSDDKKIEKKAIEKKRDMSKVKCYNYKKEGNFAKDCKKAKVKDYNYYKIKMLLAKKDSDEQVLLAEDQAWMESSSDSDQEINANMVFMAQIEKVLSESDESSSSAEETIAEEKYAKLKAERYEYMIRYSAYFDNDKQHRKQIADQQVLFDKMSVELASTNQNVHIIMPSKDNLYNGQKGIGFENLSYFEKAKDLRPTLYDEKVIGLGYTPMFLTHSNEALEIKKFKRSRENKFEFEYGYGNLNASYVNENFDEDDYFQEIINPDFEKIDSPFQQTSSLKPYVPTVILERIIIDLEDEVVSLLEKEKANLETTESLKSKGDYSWNVEKLKAKGDIGVFVGYSKESVAFRIHNKRTRKIHESVNVNFDEISEMASKQFSLKPGLSSLNEMGKSSNPSVSQVSEASKKDLEDLFQNFYDEYFDSSKIMKSSTTNVQTSINKEVFHEVFESFQREFSSSSLNDDVQQIPKEVILHQTNTQSISNNMIPNVDEASTSRNMFNERLEDAYFDASTSFHDPSNVHTYYQPYPHEKKWTKDHPLYKIIAEALKDADWVSAMQKELDQFTTLKVWRLVPRPEGKSVI
nr:integrase, catalytic region, zinc finger, CCHC-type, peptidase aspartic, catalytic [Tanacetum cinerariifolium]